MNHHNLFYGLDRNTQRLMHISEVPRGLDCDCDCPECGGELIAKKGDILQHHFAHSIAGSYECQGHGVAMTFIHKRAQELFKARSFTTYSQRYAGSEFTSDACGVIDELGECHVEVVVTSRMKEDKLAFIKTQFNEPLAVYRCDLSREQERSTFLELLHSSELYPFLIAQCVRIPTYYEVQEAAEIELQQRSTVKEVLKDRTADQLRKTGEIAGIICRLRGIEQYKVPDRLPNGVRIMVNAYPRDVIGLAWDIVATPNGYREFKREHRA